MDAAEQAGMKACHGSVKKMLQNRHYLGDEYYPAIIDRRRLIWHLPNSRKS